MNKYLLTLLALLFFTIGAEAQVKKNYTLDTTITHFSYEMEFPDGIFYSPVALDLEKADPKLGILVIPLGAIDAATAKEQLDQYIKAMSQDPKAMVDPKMEEFSFNGYKAYAVTHGIEEDGKKMLGYVAMLVSDKTAIMFASMDNTNGSYLEKFKATFKSVKLQ